MLGKTPLIIFTDERCLIGKTPYPNIPLLVNHDCRIIEVASDWLRHLMIMRRMASSSARQFAYHLKYWWTYLNREGLVWDEVNDHIMLKWRDQCLLKDEPATVNGYVSTVFRMYLWAEQNGYTSGLIGEADFARKVRPPLSVEIKSRPNGRRNAVKTYSSPLLIKTTAKPLRPTPTNDQITEVHKALDKIYGDNRDLMIRDGLILTWEEMTGVRRAEVLSLKRSQIPSWDEINALDETNETAEINVTGKGGKRRVIWATADLLGQTRDYIEEERKAIVRRWRRRLSSSYKDPQEIFLSSKTGSPLHPDTTSQKFAEAFREAGVAGSGHRVRARFLTNLVERIYERDFERLGSVPDLTSVLLPAAQIAGHSDVRTLQPYLAIARKRLTGMTTAERKALAEEKAVAAERRLGATLIKLKATRLVHELAQAILFGNKKKVAGALQKLQNALESSSLLQYRRNKNTG
jgi:integrase